MAIRWDWNDKMGKVTYDNGHESNLYKGNAFCIAINEFENETYTLSWFAADKEHMKNMLGLSKEYKENIFKDYGIKKLTLNTNYKETEQLIQMLAKAKMKITIELTDNI